MRKIWCLALILILGAFLVKTYDEEGMDAGFDGGQEDPSMDPSMDQQFLSMKRTACLVLSRYHSNNHKDTIESTI